MPLPNTVSPTRGTPSVFAPTREGPAARGGRLSPAAGIRRVEAAMSRRDLWRTIWQDAYDFGMPGRTGFFQEIVGRDRTDKIFDQTLVVAWPDHASMMVDGIVPPTGKAFALKAFQNGRKVERRDVNMLLFELTEYYHEILRDSNFYSAAHEHFIDVGLGTGYLMANFDPHKVVSFENSPQTQVAIDRGPYGGVDGKFRALTMKENDIRVRFPKLDLPVDFSSTQTSRPDAEPEPQYDLLELTYRDWSEPRIPHYYYQVLLKSAVGFGNATFSHEAYWAEYWGHGSDPWTVSRWSTASGEIYGRGPVLNVLPEVKSGNLTRQLELENDEMQIGGVWKAPFDGVTNYDNIQIVPGMVYPYMPGTGGLEPVTPPGNPELSRVRRREYQQMIREGLYVEDYRGEGRTPLSAAQVAAEQTRIIRRIGAPAARQFTEFVAPVVMRLHYIAQASGLVELPRLNGMELRVMPSSPMVQAMQSNEAFQFLNYGMAMQQMLGPAQALLYTNADQTASRLRELYGQPESIQTTAAERRALVEQAQGLQQLAQAGPQDVNAVSREVLP